jgi:hypothetical protein
MPYLLGLLVYYIASSPCNNLGFVLPPSFWCTYIQKQIKDAFKNDLGESEFAKCG